MLKGIVDAGNYRVESYTHLLDLTRNSCEKCYFKSQAGIEMSSVAQLVRALHQNRRAAGLIPARDLKLHFSQLLLVKSNK